MNVLAVIAFLVEQAEGRASTGRERILDIVPTNVHQRIGLIFGAREEVDRLEDLHRDSTVTDYEAPLFGVRGLYREVH